MSNDRDNKIIWFQHFHKAGGTSVISAAENAGWTLYPNNDNGNPLDENGRVLPIWEWDQYQLSSWLDDVASSGVNFIACEWGFSHAILELDKPEIQLVTVLRHPVERLISNFYYDVQNNYTRRHDVMEYMQAQALYAQPDYYTRIVAGSTGSSATERSFSLLQKFDNICFLGEPDCFADLEKLIPGVGDSHANRTTRNTPEFAALKQNIEANLADIEAQNSNDILLYQALAAGVDQLVIQPNEKKELVRKPVSEIILQVGPDITLSNLIAKELNNNREEIQAQNTLFFTGVTGRDSRDLISLHNDESMAEHRGLEVDRAKRRERRQFRLRTADRWNSAIEGLESAGRIVVSSHMLATELTTRQSVQHLHNLLSSASEKIKVILYLSRQDRLAVDAFNQQCLDGKCPSGMINVDSPHWSPVYNYLCLVERWRKAFDKAEFSIHFLQKENDYENLLGEFLDFAGIQRTWRSKAAEADSVGLSEFQQKALLMANRNFSDSAPLGQKIANLISEKYPRAPSLPRRETASSFYATYRESNNILAEYLEDEPPLFDSDFSQYPDSVDTAPLPEDLISDLLAICGEHFQRSARQEQHPVNPKQTTPDVLRDLGIRHIESNPRLALILLKEARELRPFGPRILEAISLLEDKLSNEKVR